MSVTVPKGGLPPRFRRVMNLAHFLLQSAKRYPSEVALVSGEDTLTWAQLNARVDAMAAALAARAKETAFLYRRRIRTSSSRRCLCASGLGRFGCRRTSA